MNIVTEAKLSGKPIADKAHKRPVRMVRWFIIVGLLLTVLVGGLVWFNYFRGKMIAQFFANNKPPPTAVSMADGEVRNDSEPADGGRRSRRRAPGQCHVGRQRPHHRDHVHGGRQRQGGHAAAAIVRRSRPGRPRQLQGAGDDGAAVARSRQATGRAPVRAAGDGRPRSPAFDQASAGIAKTRGHHLAEAGAGAVRRRTRRAQGRGRTISDRRHADRVADRSVGAVCQLHRDGKGFRAHSRSARSSVSRSMPIRAGPSRARSRPSSRRSRPTRATSACRRRSPIRTGSSSPACSRPPRWCCRTSRPVITVPETAVDYTLYGNSVFLIGEKKEATARPA